MHLIDGKALAAKILTEVKHEVTQLNRAPRLEVMLVGNDPASHLYVDLKRKAGEEAGIEVAVNTFPEIATTQELMSIISGWNNDPAIDGILVQVPLPHGIDQDSVTQQIAPSKDADGFHPANVAALMYGNLTIVPPVHEGILRLINETPLKLAGAQGVIIANSKIFAAPLQRLLTTAGASVDIMDYNEIEPERLKEADLVISAVGKLNFLTPDMVRADAVVIDVGTNKTKDGKIRGDAAAEDFKSTKAYITPVPGGVGPMTIAQLLKNVVKLASGSNPQA